MPYADPKAARTMKREWYRARIIPRFCPCGEAIPLPQPGSPPSKGWAHKFCSVVCRKVYGKPPPKRTAANRRGEYLKRTYGITIYQQAEMVNDQGGGCAVCGEAPNTVDHNHATGKVRGILCRKCNVGLGLFQDDPDLLEAAALYLRINT